MWLLKGTVLDKAKTPWCLSWAWSTPVFEPLGGWDLALGAVGWKTTAGLRTVLPTLGDGSSLCPAQPPLMSTAPALDFPAWWVGAEQHLPWLQETQKQAAEVMVFGEEG